ncbi:MAG: hypothetical protein Q4C02_10635 [Eubacteriales bacterium]|nr:hypothetical protein [Lachnospiraceae bacterium]MDO4418716.1 hypothetical protein [Eubacteriales bacterium]
MERAEKVFREADFSRETDLKERLRVQLFGEELSEQNRFRRLGEDDLELVSAAGELYAGQNILHAQENGSQTEQKTK